VIASVIDTGDQLAPGPLIRVCEMSLDAPFHISSNDTTVLAAVSTSAVVSDFGSRRYRCFGLKFFGCVDTYICYHNSH
jgi:hypothetical protein